MSELAKKMMQRHLKDEDGAAAASGGAAAGNAASVTGNAGLSSLGSVPNGPFGMMGQARKRKRRVCESCGYAQMHNEKICFECGDRLPSMDEGKSTDERLADYREQQIMLDKSDHPNGWICGAVDQIMNMMKTGYPEILHEEDELSGAVLRGRVTELLHEFETWRKSH